jgi:hypothetical protein
MATYEKAILTHIDIMGFKRLIDESQKDPHSKRVNDISNTLKTIRTQTSVDGRPTKRGKPASRFEAINFSDLTVRVSYISQDELLLEALEWELTHLATAQYQLAVQGILIRGGVSYGDIYIEKFPTEVLGHDASIIFGPALVSAYELESTIAVFPRIVIHPELMVEVHRNPAFISDEHIRRGEDGTYFIDYLRGECYRGPYTMDDVDNLLQRHKDIVLLKLKELNGEQRLKQKALWLALYHNSTIKEMNGGLARNMHAMSFLRDVSYAAQCGQNTAYRMFHTHLTLLVRPQHR